MVGSHLLPVVTAQNIGDWYQVGSDIDGREYDLFGYSLAMSEDGKTVAVGSLGRNSSVRVYNFNVAINQYENIGLDIAGKLEYEAFGSSLAMSADGTTIAVGARDGNANNSFAGLVRVYSKDVHQYKQIGIDIDGEAKGDFFGFSLAMSADGETIAIGAPGNKANGNKDAGHVRVYKFDHTTNRHNQIGSDIDGTATGNFFGYSLAISADGNTIAVGAPSPPWLVANSSTVGHVKVYKFDPTSNQFKQLGPDLTGPSPEYLLGVSIAMSADGRKIAAGANTLGYGPNYLRLYAYSAASNQYLSAGLDINRKESNETSAISMSADGTTIAASSVSYNYNATVHDSGEVRIYNFVTAANQYKQIGSNISGEAADDRFGSSLAMSKDGSTIVVGSPYNNGNGVGAGNVRAFKFKPSNIATPVPMTPTKAPNRNPTRFPTKSPTVPMIPTKAPNRNPTRFPTKSPTKAPAEMTSKCGLFGLNIFCPQPGKCGWIKRIFNMGRC
jgi:hypothetical protein